MATMMGTRPKQDAQDVDPNTYGVAPVETSSCLPYDAASRPSTVAVNPVQFVTTTEVKPLQRQFLPPNDGRGLLHSLMCDTVTSPHDPLFLGHDGKISLLQPPSTGIIIAHLSWRLRFFYRHWAKIFTILIIIYTIQIFVPIWNH